MLNRLIAAVLTAAFGLVASTAAWAEYPEKPITMIIGFNAGGGTDLAGRALAAEMSEILGQPIAVVNKPGAASMIAAGDVAKARADGYTLWFGSAGTYVTKEALGQAPTPYGEGLEIIGLSGTLVAALGVPIGSPFTSVEDIVAAAQENPGTLRWAHNGVGAAFMAMGQGFVTANDLDVVGVPFKGAKGLREALIANQVDFGVVNAGDRLRLGEDKFTVLSVIAADRSQVIDSDLPTLAEQGIPFVEVPSPVGLFVPGGTPDEVKAALGAAMEEATSRDSFVEGMAKLFIPATYLNATDADTYVKELQGNIQEILPKLRK
ncbi:MAG: tripartite tricarboxylate transporter substrate binding protein [Rhodobacteraceae bacterium]|nr:tripartite tricarboxylate transporter substrate binding protein [Paracoccaceae bacterium]MCY4326825.1 tripartite tricarboxylate transporter substrate binding protein [Paracoccaceae bacterium]